MACRAWACSWERAEGGKGERSAGEEEPQTQLSPLALRRTGYPTDHQAPFSSLPEGKGKTFSGARRPLNRLVTKDVGS